MRSTEKLRQLVHCSDVSLFSLGAKFPSVIVRDNLKVFFSRFQNRFKDVLLSFSSRPNHLQDAMETDDDSQQQQPPVESCDLLVLFIKIQMDLFTPQLER
jgi:hypothetical protein